MKRTLTDSASKPGMTLDQLAAFVADAKAAGARGDEVPKLRLFFAGGVKQIRVEVAGAEPSDR